MANQETKIYNWGITPFHDLVIDAPVQSTDLFSPSGLKLTYQQVKGRLVGYLKRKISDKEILNYWLFTPAEEDHDLEVIYGLIQEYHQLDKPIGLYNIDCITPDVEEDHRLIVQFLEVYPHWVIVEDYKTGELGIFRYGKGDEDGIIHLHCLGEVDEAESKGDIEKEKEKSETMFPMLEPETPEPIIIDLLRRRNRLLLRLEDAVSNYRLGYEDHGTTMDPDTYKTIKDMETNLITLDQIIFEADMATSSMEITINPWLIRTLSNIISNHIATNESIWEPENTEDSLKLHYLTKLFNDLNHHSLGIFGQTHETIQNHLENIEKGNK